MTLVDYKVVGRYEGFCYEKIVEDLGLEKEFESVTGEKFSEYEYDPLEMGEDRLIHKIIDEVEQEYVLYSDVTGRNERMYYVVLSIEH